jgi:hypothetical protein
MAKHVSETPATQWLKHKKVVYSENPYDFVAHGGTSVSELGAETVQCGLPV